MKHRILFSLFLLFFLSGCGKVNLHHNLKEIEADEILVLLQDNGIVAEKIKEITGQDVSWTVTVRKLDQAKSRQILISNNVPRRKELGLSGVYSEKGLIPTPDEQKARFLLAMKGEIINSLRTIPGVVDVDIVLNVPTENEFSGLDPVKKRPTASVVIKTKNDPIVTQAVSESKIQQFVANTIPNLSPNDVTAIISRWHLPEGDGLLSSGLPPILSGSVGEGGAVAPKADGLVGLVGVQMHPASVKRFKVYMIVLLLILLGVSSFLLFSIMRLNRLRLQLQSGGSGLIEPAEPPAGFLAQPRANEGAVEGTFDVGSGEGRE